MTQDYVIAGAGNQVIAGTGNNVWAEGETGALAINALNYIILTTSGSYASGDTSFTFLEDVPTTNYPFRLVVSNPFEIMSADSRTSAKVISVTRRQEGTTNTATIDDATRVVVELTYEAFDAIYTGALNTEKLIANNETAGERILREPDVNEITLDTTGNKLYVGVDGTPNTWEEFAPESHANLDDLATSTEHTQYYTTGRADTWHEAITKEHLDTLDHDHFTVPAANIRNLASQPADTVAGGVYFNTTTYTLYYYNGAEWTQYNTVPKHALIFRDDGACPAGWTEKTTWNGFYLKGASAGSWVAGSGGALTHTHTLTSIPQHAHTVPDRNITMTAVGNHSHSVAVATGGAGGKPITVNTKRSDEGTSTSATHTHTLTVPQHNTGNAGTAVALTQSSSSQPKYVELVLCEKN